MRRLLLVLFAFCPLPALAQPVSIQSPAAPFVGQSVAEVRLLIEQRPTDDPSLLDVIETPVGRPLSVAAVRESISIP